jgi:PAS domain S-box-containing protein
MPRAPAFQLAFAPPLLLLALSVPLAFGLWEAHVAHLAEAAPSFPAADAHANRIVAWGVALWALAGTGCLAWWRQRVRAWRLQEAARVRERLYRALFNIGPDAAFLMEGPRGVDPGRFIEVNDVACARLGYARQDLVGLGPSDIDASEHLPDIPVVMARLRREGTVRWEGVHVRRDGGRIPVEIVAQLVDVEGGQYILSTARDITDRKQADAERLRLAAAERLASMDALSSGVARQVAYPVASVLSNLEFAVDVLKRLQARSAGAPPDELASALRALDHARDTSARVRDTLQDLDAFTTRG